MHDFIKPKTKSIDFIPHLLVRTKQRKLINTYNETKEIRKQNERIRKVPVIESPTMEFSHE